MLHLRILAVVILSLFLLNGCDDNDLTFIGDSTATTIGTGGGDGTVEDGTVEDGTGDETVVVGTGSLTIAMTRLSDGTPTTTISLGNPALVTVTAKDANGQAVSGNLVSFSTGLGVMSPSGDVTDANGSASIELSAGTSTGADTITASTTINGNPVSVSMAYTVGTPDVYMGSGSPFTPGTLELGLGTISAGGTTSVKAVIVNGAGEPIDFPVEVTFSSNFAQLATPGATLSSPINSINGVATSSYTATGSPSGTDTITATANVGGKILQASAQIEVLPADAASIKFISAVPTNISLKGMGGDETSKVTFQVVDSFGNGSPEQLVNFSLNTSIGGLTLAELSGMTDNNGYVVATVHAGTIGTSVRVTAVLDGDPTIKTQSEQLVVSTGIPDQESFSLSIGTFNPEAWNVDGVKVPVTVHASDRFNNPVPDGTAIYFTAEGGQIQSSCNTAGGACTVDWTSSNPRPANGRVALLAHAVGEESFLDLNGNGVFDEGDTFGPQYDMPEAFLDKNENDVRDGDEQFYDYNQNGVYDLGDGRYNGLLCAHPTLCSETTSIHVRDTGVIVMSSSFAGAIDVALTADGVSMDPLEMETGGSLTVFVRVWDEKGNVMPAGTTIKTGASGQVKVSGQTNITVPNTTSLGPTVARVTLTAEAEGGTGEITVDVTSPRGDITYGYIPVTVTAPPAEPQP